MAVLEPGKGIYRVSGAVAVVTVIDGSERYLYRGASFEAEQVAAVSVDHLVSVGLIEPVKKGKSSGSPAVEAGPVVEKAAAPVDAERVESEPAVKADKKK